jgi:hypothetical protein
LNLISEGSAVGSLVGIEAYAGDGATYTLSDDAGGRFTINSTTGVVRVANDLLLDYETAQSYDIVIEATLAGVASEKTFTIDVVDDANEYFKIVEVGMSGDVATYALYAAPDWDANSDGVSGVGLDLVYDTSTMSYQGLAAGHPWGMFMFADENTVGQVTFSGTGTPLTADASGGSVPGWYELLQFEMQITDAASDKGFRVIAEGDLMDDTVFLAGQTDTDILSPVSLGVTLSGQAILAQDLSHKTTSEAYSLAGSKVFIADQDVDSSIYLRAKTLGATSTFEIVVRHDADLSGLDLDLNSTSAITNFTTNESALDWANFTDTVGSNTVDISIDQAVSGTGIFDSTVTAGTVIAEFSVTGAAEISLSNIIGTESDGSTNDLDDHLLTLTSQVLASDGLYEATIGKGNTVQIGLDTESFTRTDWIDYGKPITWQDALDALRLSAGASTVDGSKTEQDLIAANINGDSRVTWQDALSILMASAGAGYGSVDGPKFISIESGFTDSNMSYRNIDMSSVTTIDILDTDTTLNLDVILVGDVNGIVV